MGLLLRDELLDDLIHVGHAGALLVRGRVGVRVEVRVRVSGPAGRVRVRVRSRCSP